MPQSQEVPSLGRGAGSLQPAGALGDCWPMISGANEWVCEVINYLHLITHFKSLCGCIIKDMGLYRDYGGHTMQPGAKASVFVWKL